MEQSSQTVTVEGHRLTLTHLDKVLYPVTGTTKAEVLGYYAAIAPLLITHAANRPATRKRWVHGVGTEAEPASAFFQKNLEPATPSWVKRRPIAHHTHMSEYPLVNDLATLTWLGQLSVLEVHVPQWRFGRTGTPLNPDRLVLDLDPGEGASLIECAEVARLARDILRPMGLDPIPVTSGSKGIHLYAQLDLSYSSEQVSAIAHELARALEADHPALVVSEMKRAVRAGKVFVDWSQNNSNKTTIAPYSLRGRAHPFVAAPRTWSELATPGLAQLDFRQVLHRMASQADPLAALAFTGTTGRRVTDASPDLVTDDPLRAYRGKRDGAKTPEPVPLASPAELPGSPSGRSFVIHEHHARRLHWDFRLEHEGVLRSWALPKGVPSDPGRNHLAVPTEDHPLEYGAFEGHIPAGEYGAGAVSIWDRGEYELEKWRDDEVIVALHGEPGGGLGSNTAHRFALIRTEAGSPTNAPAWLIHRMKTDSRQLPPPILPPVYTPMLATPGSVNDLPVTADWAFEMKWDGMRVLATVTANIVRLHSRNGNDVTTSFPEIVEALRPAPTVSSMVLDGEVVAQGRDGRPNFGLLQTRMGLSATRRVSKAMARAPVHYLLFDILARNTEDVLDEPYSRRRQILADSVSTNERIVLPPAFDGDGLGALRASRELGLEGIVAKRKDSPYRPGRRSRAWIKVKHLRSQEVVIGGWRPGNGSRAGTIGSLLLGIPTAAGLRYVGRVGTGFRDRDLADTLSRLAPLAAVANPFLSVPATDALDARWVRPELVAEVEFAEWTEQGRLRHPSWRGWRPDKSPEEVVPE